MLGLLLGADCCGEVADKINAKIVNPTTPKNTVIAVSLVPMIPQNLRLRSYLEMFSRTLFGLDSNKNNASWLDSTSACQKDV